MCLDSTEHMEWEDVCSCVSLSVCNQSIRVLVLIKLQLERVLLLLLVVVVVLKGEGWFAYKPVEILT